MKNKWIITAAIVVGFFVAVIGFLAISYISAHNQAVQSEARLNALLDNSKNILAQGQQKVMEAAQVTDMMRDDFAKVAREAITARYGDDGSKALFQWIQEQNPNLDASVYKNIQQLIQAYRDEFKNSQTAMLDARRQYETSLNLFWRGTWMRIAGFPKIDLAKFAPIVTDRVEATYEAGKESGPLKLR